MKIIIIKKIWRGPHGGAGANRLHRDPPGAGCFASRPGHFSSAAL